MGGLYPEPPLKLPHRALTNQSRNLGIANHTSILISTLVSCKEKKEKMKDKKSEHSTMVAAPCPAAPQKVLLIRKLPVPHTGAYYACCGMTLRICKEIINFSCLSRESNIGSLQVAQWVVTPLSHRAPDERGLQFELLIPHTMQRERNEVVKKHFFTIARTRAIWITNR